MQQSEVIPFNVKNNGFTNDQVSQAIPSNRISTVIKSNRAAARDRNESRNETNQLI